MTRIHHFFFNLSTFRKEAIFHIWRDIADVPRGKMLEELLTYSRYKNYTWANATREMNGPIDFHLNGLGVQLKTIKTVDVNNSTQMSNFRAKVREGLDQLVTAKNNGWNGLTFNSTRLDVMIPPDSDMNINRLTEIIEEIINDPDRPQYSSINFQIGIFND